LFEWSGAVHLGRNRKLKGSKSRDAKSTINRKIIPSLLPHNKIN